MNKIESMKASELKYYLHIKHDTKLKKDPKLTWIRYSRSYPDIIQFSSNFPIILYDLWVINIKPG